MKVNLKSKVTTRCFQELKFETLPLLKPKLECLVFSDKNLKILLKIIVW